VIGHSKCIHVFTTALWPILKTWKESTFISMHFSHWCLFVPLVKRKWRPASKSRIRAKLRIEFWNYSTIIIAGLYFAIIYTVNSVTLWQLVGANGWHFQVSIIQKLHLKCAHNSLWNWPTEALETHVKWDEKRVKHNIKMNFMRGCSLNAWICHWLRFNIREKIRFFPYTWESYEIFSLE